MSSLSWAQRLDVYRKVPSDLSEGTTLGGVISIISILFISFLVVK